MLERNWNWRNNRLFCHIFVIGEITIRGGACLPPLAYAYAPIEENRKGVRKFSARFLAFSNKISTVQKILLSSSRRQGNFRGLEASRPRPRTWGFEVKAKAKDFKMCLRGRPRGLHLWETPHLFYLVLVEFCCWFVLKCGKPRSNFCFLFFEFVIS